MMDQELSKFKFIDDFLSDCMCSKTACNMSRFFFSFCIVVLNDYCCHKCTHCYKSHFFVPKVRTKIQVTIFGIKNQIVLDFLNTAKITILKSIFFGQKSKFCHSVYISKNDRERSVTFHMNYILRLCMNFCSGKKSREKKYTIYSYFFHAFLERRGFLYTCAVNLIFFRCNFTLRYDCANKKWCHDFKVFIFYVINVEFQKGCPRVWITIQISFCISLL